MDVKASAEELCDEIRIKGIRAKGYGQITKAAILDPDLSIEAKGILAYFCSFCGGGNTAFPGRDRIVHDLRMSKDTYYRHLKSLISNGYISVEQKAGDAGHPGFRHNVYTIENFPAKFSADAPSDAGEMIRETYRKIQAVKDIAAGGYGIVPKAVMLDEISIQAKGLYAYLCAFSGQDFTAAPPRDIILAHLGISHNSSNKYMKELTDSGYVSRIRATEGGRFAGFIYCLTQVQGNRAGETELCEVPEPNISDAHSLPQPSFSDPQTAPKPNNPDAHIHPQPVFSDTRSAFPQTVLPDTQISDCNITRLNKKTHLNVLSINQQLQAFSADSSKDALMEGSIDLDDIILDIIRNGVLPFSYLKNPLKLNTALKALTDWDIRTGGSYGTSDETKLYKSFISALSEMMTDGNITVIRGAKISFSMVYQALIDNRLSITTDGASLEFFPDECIDQYMEMSRKRRITDSGAYMKSIIWTKLKEAGAGAVCFDSGSTVRNHGLQTDH